MHVLELISVSFDSYMDQSLHAFSMVSTDPFLPEKK